MTNKTDAHGLPIEEQADAKQFDVARPTLARQYGDPSVEILRMAKQSAAGELAAQQRALQAAAEKTARERYLDAQQAALNQVEDETACYRRLEAMKLAVASLPLGAPVQQVRERANEFLAYIKGEA